MRGVRLVVHTGRVRASANAPAALVTEPVTYRVRKSPLRVVTAFFGFALALISIGSFINGTVNAATYVAPTATPPGGNIPAMIWNRTASGATQTGASIDVDGTITSGSMASFGKSTLALTGTQNLYYGNVSGGPATASLLLLQNNSVTKFRVDLNGNITYSGSLTTTGCFGRVFTGLTTAAYTPNLPANTSGSTPNPNLSGYFAADQKCATQYAGSHVCRADEIIESAQCSAVGDPIRLNGGNAAWINDGPPGASAYNASDCLGWTTNTNTTFGRVWLFDNTTGGRGTLTGCNIPAPGLKFACCK